MAMSPRIAIPIWLSLLFLLSTALAMPPRRLPAPPSRPSLAEYVQFYHSQTSPLDFYHPDPLHVAPIRMSKNADAGAYLDRLGQHQAYIHPEPDEPIRLITERMAALTLPRARPTRADQRAFMSLFEELSGHSKDRIQTALHPTNVRAQHIVAIDRQLKQLNGMMGMFDSDDKRKLSGHLDALEKERLTQAYRVFSAEIPLLTRARLYATKLPVLI